MGEQSRAGADGTGPSGAGETERWPFGSSRRGRIGRRIGQVLLALLLVSLLVWGVMFLRVFVLLPRTAQDEASEGYELMLEEFAQLAAADAAVLDPEFGAPLGTVRTVDCAVDSSDRGWFVADHRNDCSLREIEVRGVPEGATDPAVRATALLDEVEAWQGDPGYLFTADAQCTGAGESRLPADDRVPVNLPNIDLAAVVVADLDALDSCLDDYSRSPRTLERTTFQDQRGSAPTVPDGTQLLIVVRDARISSSSMGCLPLPMFCQPAVTAPQLPAGLDG